MNYSIKWLLTPFLVLAFSAATAQSHGVKMERAEQYAEEVFKGMYTGPEYMKVYKEHMGRVEIITEAAAPGQEYPLLSQVILINKYNPALTRDEQHFVPGSFNPLKYAFDFDAATPRKYRVDNTDYVIVIHPKS